MTRRQAATADRALSAAHISQVLARKFPRASNDEYGQSGFIVQAPQRTDASRMVVPVGYHSWERPYDYSNEWRAHMERVTRAAFARYARHLRQAGYVTEKWMRYDDVQLGLFVTGRRR